MSSMNWPTWRSLAWCCDCPFRRRGEASHKRLVACDPSSLQPLKVYREAAWKSVSMAATGFLSSLGLAGRLRAARRVFQDFARKRDAV